MAAMHHVPIVLAEGAGVEKELESFSSSEFVALVLGIKTPLASSEHGFLIDFSEAVDEASGSGEVASRSRVNTLERARNGAENLHFSF